MSIHPYPRRSFISLMLAAPFFSSALMAAAEPPAEALITDFGAKSDGTTVNTKAIQAAIDHLAASAEEPSSSRKASSSAAHSSSSPRSTFACKRARCSSCSTDMSQLPRAAHAHRRPLRGKIQPRPHQRENCDGFQLTGEGTLDGAGRPIWDEFWKERNTAPDPHNFPNIGIPRARLALIEGSRDVKIEGITFKDSQFWNLHLYNNDGVLVHNVRFQVPDDYKQAPSTDGIDVDSSRNVTVDGCFFSVTDDCIALKGSKGPHAMEDTTSPPVEHIRVRNCTYKRGGGVLTLGSEATIVRDVIVENCKIVGNVRVATLKLRADTPQHYEDITFRNITSDTAAGPILSVQPWSQYFNFRAHTAATPSSAT